MKPHSSKRSSVRATMRQRRNLNAEVTSFEYDSSIVVPDVTFDRNTTPREPGGKNEIVDTEDGGTDDELIEFKVQDPVQAQREVKKKKYSRRYINWTKMWILIIIWLIFTILLLLKPEMTRVPINFCVPANEKEKDFGFPSPPFDNLAGLSMLGAFVIKDYEPEATLTPLKPGPLLSVVVQQDVNGARKDVSSVWSDTMVDPDDFDSATIVDRTQIFKLTGVTGDDPKLFFHFTCDSPMAVSLQLTFNAAPVPQPTGIIYAGLVLLGIFIFLFLDLLHRAVCIMIAATAAIGALAAVNARPSLPEIMQWIHVDALMVYFGMTIFAAIVAETGLLDYTVLKLYELANGHIWPTINCLCLVTICWSTILDSITMLLFVTPITVSICEIVALNPIPVLTFLIFAANIGAILTPMGDPPNDILIHNVFVQKSGLNFFGFIMRMLPPVLLITVATYALVRVQFHNSEKMKFTDAPEVQRLRRVIKVWKRTAIGMTAYSKREKAMREKLVTKVNKMHGRLRRLGKMPPPSEDFEGSLNRLKETHKVRDKHLLIMCGIGFAFILIVFMIEGYPHVQHLSIGWTAILGVLLVLLLADMEDFEGLLGRIEWSTLLFFSVFFVLCETLARLGLITSIGRWAEQYIINSSSDTRFAVALMVILCVSAAEAAVVDNRIVAREMIRVIVTVCQTKDVNLPVRPLVCALALGAGIGGNATLISTYANVVAAGVVERFGYNFFFWHYFKIGFPVTLVGMLMAAIWLLIANVAFRLDYE